MVYHEFGIMMQAPEEGKQYNEYEPQKYNCISVSDDCLENIVEKLQHIDFYWHTLENKQKGIAYYGITLIPPTSIYNLIDVIKGNPNLVELKELADKALKENKWMIHFGV